MFWLIVVAGGAVVSGVAFVASVARPRKAARGDPELAALVDELCDRRVRRLAVVAVDIRAGWTQRALIRSDVSARFELGSISKALTGMLLADAINGGEVRLSTTVSEVRPDLADTKAAHVTLRELCTHTSGLPRLPISPMTLVRVWLADVGLNPYAWSSPEKVIRVAAAQRLRTRGRYAYSNLGAALLGQLLAHRAGMDYETLLRRRLLGPLAMNGAGVATPRWKAPLGWSALGLPRAAWTMGGYAPAGGVVATLADIEAIAHALLEGRAPGQESLLPIEGVATDRAGRQRGMFWVIDPTPDGQSTVIWHNGKTGGYSSFLLLVPAAQRAVAVLADTARSRDAQRIAIAVATRLRR